MKRNDLTRIGALTEGDRFYKANDKKKQPMVIVMPPHTTKHWCCPAEVIDCTILLESHKRNRYRTIAATTEVVFLRHSTI